MQPAAQAAPCARPAGQLGASSLNSRRGMVPPAVSGERCTAPRPSAPGKREPFRYSTSPAAAWRTAAGEQMAVHPSRSSRGRLRRRARLTCRSSTQSVPEQQTEGGGVSGQTSRRLLNRQVPMMG